MLLSAFRLTAASWNTGTGLYEKETTSHQTIRRRKKNEKKLLKD
jgi:hypothetical protein